MENSCSLYKLLCSRSRYVGEVEINFRYLLTDILMTVNALDDMMEGYQYY